MAKLREVIGFRGLARPAFSGCALALALAGCDDFKSNPSATHTPTASPRVSRSPPPAAASHPIAPVASIPQRTEACGVGLADAARQNQGSLQQLPLVTRGRVETGWDYYEPLIAREIGTHCEAATPAFASDLAAWQSAHGLVRSGVMDQPTFAAMRTQWDLRRPFVVASRLGCPAAPPESSLATVPVADSYGGKTMLLRPGALAAYARMLAAARAEVPDVASDRRMMTLFSAYRSPQADAARCASENNCYGVMRATCSAHLTGLAMDLYLGAAPGDLPDASDDANRLYISHGAAYRWMIGNAWRFGFVPYPFEPWHWEWTGEPI